MSKLGRKLFYSESFIFTFIRSIGASQISAWTDFGVGFIFFAFLNLSVFTSSSIGAIAGGIVNCIINYKFTFRHYKCQWETIAIKYFIIWLGSLLLNSYGTSIGYYLLNQWNFLEEVGVGRDGYYTLSRLLVSLIVSVGWNFIFQKYFVYRPHKIDKYLSYNVGVRRIPQKRKI